MPLYWFCFFASNVPDQLLCKYAGPGISARPDWTSGGVHACMQILILGRQCVNLQKKYVLVVFFMMQTSIFFSMTGGPIGEGQRQYFFDLLRPYAERWKDIAKALGFRGDQMISIENNADLDQEKNFSIFEKRYDHAASCLNLMLAKWLHWQPGDLRSPPTSQDIQDAVRGVLGFDVFSSGNYRDICRYSCTQNMTLSSMWSNPDLSS